MRHAFINLTASLLCTTAALAQHGGDVGLSLVAIGKETFRIETSLLVAKGDPIPGERVFAAEMGEARTASRSSPATASCPQATSGSRSRT
jgi:hypothetical protein